MSRLGSRITRVEQAIGRGDDPACKVHMITAETDTEQEAAIAAMIADGRADGPDDFFIVLRPMDPMREAA